jgi:carboxyl-terminal processing protease
MKHRAIVSFVLLSFALLQFDLQGQENRSRNNNRANSRAQVQAGDRGPAATGEKPENLPPAVVEDTQRNIARVTAKLLEQSHYSRKELNDTVSEQFLQRYLDTLDPMRIYFLQTDTIEFSKYQHNLDDLLDRRGDTGPGFTIFDRYVERVGQRVAFSVDQLRGEQFKFTDEERYHVDREKADRPKNLSEAKTLWKQHLRHEVLQELLSTISLTNLTTNAQLSLDEKTTQALKKFSESLSGTNYSAAVKKLTNRYHRLQKTVKEMRKNDIFELYLTSLAHVYDPHTDYMGHSQLENFAIHMKLSLFGIGALLGSEDGYCELKELIPGGPAEKSKQLKPKDRILAVGQGAAEPVDVFEMPLTKIVEMIRGPKGTEVRLVVQPAGADPSVRKTINLIRDEIPLVNQEAKAKIIDTAPGQANNKRLGVIDLPSFYADFGFDGSTGKERKSTTADVSRLLKKLTAEKVDGVILDLRRNTGGSLEESINLTGLFIPTGPVVQRKDSSGEVLISRDEDPKVLYSGPLVVLTSRFSASASEILAGALQDYGRALIVGDSSTHGKGTVQSLVQLGPLMDQARMPHAFDPGALKITIQKFYRAGGASTQLKGVTPDIVLPSVNNHAKLGEASLDNPLPWDEVPAAKFEKMNMVAPYLAELKKRSEQRISNERDFAYLREDIEYYKKLIADKTISLNAEQRIREKFEAEQREQTRKKERLARKETGEKIYDITLKNVDEPGLPAPSPKTNEVSTALSPSLESTLPTSPDAASGDDKPAVDITLEEAKRILGDYLQVAGKQMMASKTADR